MNGRKARNSSAGMNCTEHIASHADVFHADFPQGNTNITALGILLYAIEAHESPAG